MWSLSFIVSILERYCNAHVSISPWDMRNINIKIIMIKVMKSLFTWATITKKCDHTFVFGLFEKSTICVQWHKLIHFVLFNLV